ncbi:hypothetical protein RFI_13531 [Reticulomyxa filosa]|uniref:Uncharacterized protein n=1 Tax=Reticulomyxa filosa TaxID=46433 RepID=X6NCM5_RETFI|nr:hypothetical protein RFI_13531 [Reticulomyxa filosa]|eukprot:ETO23648.1 hypothetical protein RFI_13531 [Reticulomyxa filosa]
MSEVSEFFDTFGIVVIDNVLSNEECEKSQDEIWSHLESTFDQLDRNDISTWSCVDHHQNAFSYGDVCMETDWNSHQGESDSDSNGNGNGNGDRLHNAAVMAKSSNGMRGVLSLQFCENRQNEAIYKVVKAILSSQTFKKIKHQSDNTQKTWAVLTDDFELTLERVETPLHKNDLLSVNIDSYWFVNPTSNVPSSHKHTNTSAAACTSCLFMNCNPSAKHYSMRGFQAFVDQHHCIVEGALVVGEDNIDNAGGLQCIPGFHKKKVRRQWWKQRANGTVIPGTSYLFDSSDFITNFIQKCPARKGSLILWNIHLPHGLYATKSSNGKPWLSQLLRYGRRVKPLLLHPKQLPIGFELSSIGEEIFTVTDKLIDSTTTCSAIHIDAAEEEEEDTKTSGSVETHVVRTHLLKQPKRNKPHDHDQHCHDHDNTTHKKKGVTFGVTETYTFETQEDKQDLWSTWSSMNTDIKILVGVGVAALLAGVTYHSFKKYKEWSKKVKNK